VEIKSDHDFKLVIVDFSAKAAEVTKGDEKRKTNLK